MAGLSSKEFWASAAERAAKTVAQTLITSWPTVVGFFDLTWGHAFLAALCAALSAGALSVVTSIASSGIGPDGSPSLVGEPPAVAPDTNPGYPHLA